VTVALKVSRAIHMPVTYWHFNIIAMILDWWKARGHRASGEQYVADTGFVRGGTGRNNYVADGVIFVEGFQPNMDDTTFSSDVIHTIVEAVSSTSEERDADDKFAVYASLGIPNYWIVRRDPRAADPEAVDGMITMYELRDGAYYTAGYKAVSKL